MAKASLRITLPDEWYVETVLPGVDPWKRGLYKWRIEGVGSYIGQYTWESRPRRQYAINVTRLLNRMPYRNGKDEGFRRIHWELAAAIVARRQIDLFFLENVEWPRINERESALIKQRGNLNGPQEAGHARQPRDQST